MNLKPQNIKSNGTTNICPTLAVLPMRRVAQAEAIKDDIKAEMTERNVDEMMVDGYIVKYIDVLTTRFDTKRFKEQLGEATYNAFTKQVSSKRFSIAH